MRREWGAAGRDVAQVREGVETSPRESEWRGQLAEETRVCPRGEWGSEERSGRCAEETRGQLERGVGQ